MKRLLAKKDPLIPSDLWQEIEKLKERNRQLRLKIGAERRESIEKISELEHQAQNLTQRLQTKQIRLDELETEGEEIETLRRNLENSDRLVAKKNQEISELNSRLAATNQKVAERDEEIERLESQLTTASKKISELEEENSEQLAELKAQDAEIEELKSELARRSQTPTENLAPIAIGAELPEAADVLNQLKAKRKKSKTDLADLEVILEILEES